MPKKPPVAKLASIIVESQDELEKIVHEKIKSGANFRDIAKTPFELNGSVRHLNPSQISQIRGKFEPKKAQTSRDPDKVTVFKLLKKKIRPVDIVIKTGIPSEIVNQAVKEFVEFEQITMVPTNWLDEMKQVANLIWLGTGFENEFDHILDSFKTTKKSHDELKNHTYPCSVCGKPVALDGDALQAAIRYIKANRWYHNECELN